MRHKFLVLTVKKSVYIYGSYRKIKTGLSLFWTTLYTLHHVTRMLDDNSYVRCILVDFTNAFDTIKQEILFSKLQTLPIHVRPVIFSWLVNFLTGRTQAVCLNGSVSEFLDINQSIIQGSGVGPVLTISYYALEIFAIKSQSCPKSRGNVDVIGSPILGGYFCMGGDALVSN